MSIHTGTRRAQGLVHPWKCLHRRYKGSKRQCRPAVRNRGQLKQVLTHFKYASEDLAIDAVLADLMLWGARRVGVCQERHMCEKALLLHESDSYREGSVLRTVMKVL